MSESNTESRATAYTAISLQRSSEATAEAASLRLAELQHISNRLARLANEPLGRKWMNGYFVLLGIAGGGAFGGVAILIADTKLATWGVVLYVTLLAGCLFAALLFERAAKDMHVERTESVKAIKEDLDEMIASYMP